MCRLLPVLLLLLLSLSLCASSISFVIASAATPCTYNGFDFTSLNKPAGYQVTSDYTYRWQICGIYTADATCASKSGALCLYSGASFVFAAAKDVTTPSAAVWSTTGNGAKLTYNNGDVVTNKAATVNIELQCGDDAKTPTAAFDTKNFIINVVQYTQLACKSGPPGPDGPSGGDSGSSDGLSGGWIFVIILLVSITLYVVFGCVYKTKQQGTRGVESCPNIDFWRELPRLVRDGCVFTFVKLRGLCGGSHSSMSGKGEYDSLK